MQGTVRSVYQPVVDLESRSVVAYEALARGAGPAAGASPADLFAQAAQDGCEDLLDWECRGAAVAGALRARLPAGVPLFVNAEPRYLETAPPDHVRPLMDRAAQRLTTVVEITERALVADPAGLLRAVRRLRAAGWGIALDDVGAVPESLALLPFVDPDVIKLDLRLVQQRTDREVAVIANAVRAQAERSGAEIVAEGIETEAHLERARVLGATLGQGWLLGRPEELPRRVVAPRSGRDIRFRRDPVPQPATPFDVVRESSGWLRPAAATKSLLLPISHLLEGHALTAAEPPVLLSAFEDVAHFTRATRARYTTLASLCSFVAALGAGMPSVPAAGVRGAALPAGDPLRGQWAVVVVGPHFAGALLAQDLGDVPGGELTDGDRRFEYVITHDRDRVLQAARALMLRVAADGPRPG